MNSSFKQFNPLRRLNTSLTRSEAFQPKKQHDFLDSDPPYQRFEACTTSFERNFLSLQRTLDRIASHFHIAYSKDDGARTGQYMVVKDAILLSVDLQTFFVTMKILLDDIAFFTPFYYKRAISRRKDKDMRDSERPWGFREMKGYFLKEKSCPDQQFADLLGKHSLWMDEVCDIRRLLLHRFHSLVIDHDFWTRSYFAFVYEFNRRKGFIPDVFLYVAKVYFKLVRFLRDYEVIFKNRCAEQFSSFEYFSEGCSYVRKLNEVHLFFASLGRILDNRILIRVHRNRRRTIARKLEEIMREENLVCNECCSFGFQIRPTVEESVLISAQCACGKALPIPLIVEKKFFPYFMDKNRRENSWGLIPYTLDKPN